MWVVFLNVNDINFILMIFPPHEPPLQPRSQGLFLGQGKGPGTRLPPLQASSSLTPRIRVDGQVHGH